MKWISAIMAALALVVALVQPGCSTQLSPTQQYQVVSNSYSEAVRGMAQAADLGWIDVSTARRFDEVRREAAGALDDWGAALGRGESYPTSRAAMDLVDRMLTMKLGAAAGGESPPTPAPEEAVDHGSPGDHSADPGSRDGRAPPVPAGDGGRPGPVG